MRSASSILVSISLTGVFGLAAAAGCAAEGADVAALEGDPSSDAAAPPMLEAADAGDPLADAGPPNPGDSCTDRTQTFERPCGLCGKERARCNFSEGSSTGVVGSYGACEDEKEGGCVPGTTQPCGNCGVQTCTVYCGWGSCLAQGACAPGAVEYTTAGCTVPETYSTRTCSPTCAWGSLSPTCEEPANPNKMTLSTTIGDTVSAEWAFTPDALVKRVTGACGSTTYTADGYQGVFVEVKNPSTTEAITFSAFHSKADGGAELDTRISVYARSLRPQTDGEYKACDFGIEDSCASVSGTPCGNELSSYNFAGLGNVTIAPGGKVLVFSVGASKTVTGSFKLNLRTEAVE